MIIGTKKTKFIILVLCSVSLRRNVLQSKGLTWNNYDPSKPSMARAAFPAFDKKAPQVFPNEQFSGFLSFFNQYSRRSILITGPC